MNPSAANGAARTSSFMASNQGAVDHNERPASYRLWLEKPEISAQKTSHVD
jgi:hypothetical protein